LDAAGDLIRSGARPTVPEAAEAAGISRRTAYRYFPSQEQLLTEAALETLRPAITASFEHIESDPEARVDAVVRAVQHHAAQNEELLRTVIRLTIERGPENGEPVRGSRRMDWIADAVAPVKASLTPAAYSRLLSALSLCVGAEALITLRDVRGLSLSDAANVSSWAARALLRSALEEAKAAPQTAARKAKR
jgi:AcrR family transcriptional regulator